MVGLGFPLATVGREIPSAGFDAVASCTSANPKNDDREALT